MVRAVWEIPSARCRSLPVLRILRVVRMTQRGPVRINKRFTLGWIIWLFVFAAMEGAALLDPRPGDTLTEHIRVWFSLSNPTHWIGRGVLALFLAWLCWHFMYPRKPRNP